MKINKMSLANVEVPDNTRMRNPGNCGADQAGKLKVGLDEGEDLK